MPAPPRALPAPARPEHPGESTLRQPAARPSAVSSMRGLAKAGAASPTAATSASAQATRQHAAQRSKVQRPHQQRPPQARGQHPRPAAPEAAQAPAVLGQCPGSATPRQRLWQRPLPAAAGQPSDLREPRQPPLFSPPMRHFVSCCVPFSHSLNSVFNPEPTQTMGPGHMECTDRGMARASELPMRPAGPASSQ